LKEGRTAKLSENRVLRRTFGPKREAVAGGWRRLHNEELHNLYASPNIIKAVKSARIRWAGLVARRGEMTNAHSILVGRPEWKRPIGSPKRTWEYNIRMDRREKIVGKCIADTSGSG
jgi:hypothetical protein